MKVETGQERKWKNDTNCERFIVEEEIGNDEFLIVYTTNGREQIKSESEIYIKSFVC